MLRCALRASLCCQEMGFPPGTNHCSLLQKGSTVTATQHELCKKGEATQIKGCLVLGSTSRELLEKCHCLQGETLCSIRQQRMGQSRQEIQRWTLVGGSGQEQCLPQLSLHHHLSRLTDSVLLICNAIRPTYRTARELLLSPFYSPSCLGREHAFGFTYAVVSLFWFFILFFFFPHLL